MSVLESVRGMSACASAGPSTVSRRELPGVLVALLLWRKPCGLDELETDFSCDPAGAFFEDTLTSASLSEMALSSESWL